MKYNDTAKHVFFHKDTRNKKRISHKFPKEYFYTENKNRRDTITSLLTMFNGSIVDRGEIKNYQDYITPLIH